MAPAAHTDHPGEGAVSPELAERARGLGITRDSLGDWHYASGRPAAYGCAAPTESPWAWADDRPQTETFAAPSESAALTAACEWPEAQREAEAKAADEPVSDELAEKAHALNLYKDAGHAWFRRPDDAPMVYATRNGWRFSPSGDVVVDMDTEADAVRAACVFLKVKVPAAPAPKSHPLSSACFDGTCRPSTDPSVPVAEWRRCCHGLCTETATHGLPPGPPTRCAEHMPPADPLLSLQQRLDATEEALAEARRGLVERERRILREQDRTAEASALSHQYRDERDALRRELTSATLRATIAEQECDRLAGVVAVRDEALGVAEEAIAGAIKAAGCPGALTLDCAIAYLHATLAEADAEIERLTLASPAPTDTLAAMCRRAREDAARIEMLERGIVGLAMRLGGVGK